VVETREMDADERRSPGLPLNGKKKPKKDAPDHRKAAAGDTEKADDEVTAHI